MGLRHSERHADPAATATASALSVSLVLRPRRTGTGFSKVAAPLMAGMKRKANKKDLSRLKSILEGSGADQ